MLRLWKLEECQYCESETLESRVAVNAGKICDTEKNMGGFILRMQESNGSEH